MSTLTSVDMPVSNKSSTKRMAPPGGRTTINLGGFDEPAAPAKKQAEPVAAAPAPAAKPAPAAEAKVAVRAPAAPVATKVGLAFTTGLAAETLRGEVVAQLQAHGVENHVAYTVPDVLQLPYAAQYLVRHAAVEVVIALGVIADDGWVGQSTAQATLTGLLQAGLEAGVPVVPAVVLSDTTHGAKQTIKRSAQEWVSSALALADMKRGATAVVDLATLDVAPAKASEGASAAAAAAPGGTSSPSTSLLLTSLRESLKERGARGIFGLARKFKIMDDDGSGELDFSEFKKAIHEHALNWTDTQLREVFDYFDQDGSRTISYDEFLVGVRGELNARRSQLVLMAFEILDKDKSGAVEINDIAGAYDASQHPDVLSGKRTKSDIYREFLDTFDGGEKDGKVTPDEFIKYYSNVSASIDDDDYFELMIRNAWHISGGEGWSANTTCRRVLVTHPDGRQTVEEIKNDLGIRADDKEAMLQRLREQGVNAVGIELFGSMDTTTPPANPGAAPAKKPAAVAAPAPAPAAPASNPGTPSRRQAPGGNTTIVLG